MRSGPDLIPFLVAGGGIAFFALIAVIGMKQGKRTRERLQVLADSLGLELEPPVITLGLFYGLPRAKGLLRGKHVAFFNYTTGAGKTRKTWSAITARPSVTTSLTFSLKKQGFGTKIAGWFGAKEITVGEPVFDAAWFVQTNRPDFLRAALVPELQAKLLAAQRAGASGHFELKDGMVKYVELGSFTTARIARFPTLMDLTCDLADVAEVSARS